MKLGLVTNCFNYKSWEDVCRFAKEAELKTIEVCAGALDGKRHCNPGELLKDDDKLRKFINIAKKNKIKINSLDCTGNFLHPQKKIAERHISDLEETMKLASRIGVKVIKCLAGCPGAAEDAVHPNWITFPWPAYFGQGIKWQWEKRIIPFWERMVKKAKKAGVKFGIEMHPGDSVYNIKTFLKLRDEVGAEEIACTMDPSHLFYQGIDPIVSLRNIVGSIVIVHAKDCKIDKTIGDSTGIIDWEDFKDVNNRSWNYRTVGYGNGIEFWGDFLATLRLVGYDGVINIEHEDFLINAEEGIKKAANFLRNIIPYEKKDKSKWWI